MVQHLGGFVGLSDVMGEKAVRGGIALKGHGLSRRLLELKSQGVKLTEPLIARHLGKSRSTVANWKAGQNWPSPAEEAALEDLLTVPRGFFARLAAGKSYEDALIPNGHEDTAQSAKRDTLRQLAHLLTSPPTQRVGVYSIEEIQSHIANQISLLYRIAMPGGIASEEGMKRATELLHSLVAPRPKPPRPS